MKIKQFLLWSFISVFLGAGLVLLSDFHVSYSVKNQHSASLQEIEQCEVALVLGTIRDLQNGYRNPYYQYRIDAVVDLYQSRKIKRVLLSGDNGTQHYNEPLDMKRDLIEAGIPSSKIYLDFAGFRTYDSMYRCKHVFGCNNPIVISQQFHNERALYIANALHMKSQGYDAQDVPLRFGAKVRFREMLARCKMRMDIVTGIPPRFIGEQIKMH